MAAYYDLDGQKYIPKSRGDEGGGYECSEKQVTVINQTVTTVVGPEGMPMALLSYSKQITAEKITVTFDGVQYVCSRKQSGSAADGNYYGGLNNAGVPDFSEYPFLLISSSQARNFIITPAPGEHVVSVTITKIEVTTTESFKNAVQSVAGLGYKCAVHSTDSYSDSSVSTEPDGDLYKGVFLFNNWLMAPVAEVVFDGVKYKCNGVVDDSGNVVSYGAADYDMSEIPFLITSTYNASSDDAANELYTSIEGSHDVEITLLTYDILEISPELRIVVDDIIDRHS